MHTILLTGATGNLGSRTLVELLDTTDAAAILLVYAESDDAAKTAVTEVLHFWDRVYSTYADRLLILASDLTKPDLGLSPKDYATVANRTTHLIHCAANFKLDLSLTDARASILGATQNLVTLVTSTSQTDTFKRFNYISSLDAGGARSGPVPEAFVPSTTKKFLNTYQQAKAEAEDYLYTLSTTKAFPITVYRPSMLVGDSTTGQIINGQSLYHIINDMFLNPASSVLPGKQFRIDPIPINIIATALVHMYDAAETEGRVFNLVSGYEKSLPLPKLVAQLQGIYQKLEGTVRPSPRFISPLLPYLILTIGSFCTFGTLRTSLRKQRDLVRYFFLDLRPDNQATNTFLAARGITIPHLSDYLPLLCQYIYTEQKNPTSLHTK